MEEINLPDQSPDLNVDTLKLIEEAKNEDDTAIRERESDPTEIIKSEIELIESIKSETESTENANGASDINEVVRKDNSVDINSAKIEQIDVEMTCNEIKVVRDAESTTPSEKVARTGNSMEISDHNESQDIPVFNFSKTPIQLTGSWTEFNNKDNFFKGCKWAPDGSCLLTNNNDGLLRLWNLPDVFYSENKNWNNIPEMTPVLKIREGELIYDYCWYPMMSSLDYNTCCLASTSRNNPVHLFDAYTGEIRCSYRAYNHVDEVESAHSVCFSDDGQKLLCGFNKVIRIFDVSVPGRTFKEFKTKRAQMQGQTGIISCIAMNPVMKDVYAAGSYLKSIALYSETDGSLICLLQGQQGGITHLMFSPDGNKIFSGGRMDPEILCWDLRNPGTVLFAMLRQVTTNQRIYFTGDSTCRYVLSGNNNGSVSIWDTENAADQTTGEVTLDTIHTFQAHSDCVNGINLHPTLPLMVTTSGQRKFPEPRHSDDSDSSSDEILTDKYIYFDNSLRLWWLA